ncbi:MAG: hypothetical protein JXB05_14215 [Myxococcaceae bacterium]|nr:hypothetical protein [Myxococcaceae bacterium]
MASWLGAAPTLLAPAQMSARKQPAIQQDSCAGMGFYPVGFSSRGVFAYLLYTDEDALAVWRRVVVDLVTDKKLEEVRLEDPEGDIGLERFLWERGAEMGRILERLRIDAAPTGPVAPVPYTLDGDVLSVEPALESRDELSARFAVKLTASGPCTAGFLQEPLSQDIPRIPGSQEAWRPYGRARPWHVMFQSCFNQQGVTCWVLSSQE